METEITPSIFLCYRRDDSMESATRLYEWLAQRLPHGAVFLDLVSSPGGVDWRANVQRLLPQAKVMIVVVGPHWAGDHLLEDENPVCFELVTAHDANVPILPLLVNNAVMPAKSDLPKSIQWLAPDTALRLRADPRDRQTDLAIIEERLRTLADVRLAHIASGHVKQQLRLYREALHWTGLQIGAAQSELTRDGPNLDLGLNLQPDAVTPPYPQVGPTDELRQEPPPPGATLISLLGEYRALLLLGASGAGKTTVLQQLGLTLLEQAKTQAAAAPEATDATDAPLARCPLYLNLASWAFDSPPLSLDAWLLKRLQIEYPFSHRDAEAVIADVPLLLLLDGLDELAPAALPACIAAITSYLAARSYTIPLAVACRDDVYFAQSARLRAVMALHTQPLTQAQIAAYLDRPDDPYIELRATLDEDEAFAELSHTPLWLSLMAQVYAHGAQPPVIPAPRKGTEVGLSPTVVVESDPRRRLFARYVEMQLNPTRRPRRKPTRRAKATTDEAPPATRDELEPITVVYPPAEARHWLVEMATILVKQKRYRLYLETLQPSLAKRPRVIEWWAYVAYALLLGLGVGGIVGIAEGPLIGVVFGVVFGVVGGILGTGNIAIFDRLGFNLAAFWRGFGAYFNWRNRLFTVTVLAAPLGGLLLGLALARLSAPSGEWLATVPLWLAIGFIGGLLGGVFWMAAMSLASGLVAAGGEATSYKPGEAPTYRAPNVGIARTGRRGLMVGLVVGAVVGLFAGLDYGIQHGALGGVSVFLLIGLLFGLGGWLKHWLLRLELAREGVTPYRYVRFLRFAHDRGLLLQFGNGFEFIHGSLRDYLASLGDEAGDQPRE